MQKLSKKTQSKVDLVSHSLTLENSFFLFISIAIQTIYLLNYFTQNIQ